MHLLLPITIDIEHFLYCSRGTFQTNERLGECERYERFAHVPEDDFCSHALSLPLRQMQSQAHAYENESPFNFVALLDLRAALRPLLRNWLDALAWESATNLAAQVDIGDVLTECLRHMALDFDWTQSRFRTIGLVVNRPGSRTVTEDPATGLRLGLHLDSWDSGALRERSNARNRICVNLGVDDRFFLFLPVSGTDIDDGVPISERPSEDTLGRPATPTDIARVFFSRHPDCSVYRLRVPAGYAYIAPTENLPHDGSTLGATHYDFAVHAMADFVPRPSFMQKSNVLPIKW